MRIELFKEFLNFNWLRPENALLLVFRSEQYQSTLEYFGTGNRNLDVSCGDGVFSFITLGGKLSIKSDMYRSLNLNQKREGDFDVFDNYSNEYIIENANLPEYKYKYGIDWKQNLLDKAKHLQFYDQLIKHDNNYQLPFKDSSMEYIYSNSAYWIKNFDTHLKDLARITDKGGKIVLQMKTIDILKNTSYNYLPFMGDKFHDIIDAGRHSTWEGLRSKNDILKILNRIPNIEIISVKSTYGSELLKIWDIGMRPLFRPLVKMANNLDELQRIRSKRNGVQFL